VGALSAGRAQAGGMGGPPAQPGHWQRAVAAAAALRQKEAENAAV